MAFGWTYSRFDYPANIASVNIGCSKIFLPYSITGPGIPSAI